MYSRLPAFVFGFHGCDKSTKDAVLSGKMKGLLPSKNKYDWLGSGIYFWEQNPKRALAFAENAKSHPKLYSKSLIETPAVIGAVIDLGNCMNLLDAIHIERLKDAYLLLKATVERNNTELPSNKGTLDDKPYRALDRAVFETLHQFMADHPEEFIPYDTVRSPFWEGDPVYPGATFKKETHIQLCVRNENCIKAYFDPREMIANPFDSLYSKNSI